MIDAPAAADHQGRRRRPGKSEARIDIGSVEPRIGADQGEQRRVARAELLDDRDFPVLNDYRALLGGLFARLWGMSDDRVESIFPRVVPVDLGLV